MHLPDELLEQFIEVVDALPTTFNEIELMNQLNRQFGEHFKKPDMSDSFLLFQFHFLIMHLAYQIKSRQLLGPDCQLVITPINFQKQATKAVTHQAVDSADVMQEYYLDLTNLEKETPQSIDDALNNFWQRFSQQQDKSPALAILKLDASASPAEIKASYKCLAMQHHPDRGGDAQQFAKINWAWQQLKP